jgi:hypothetical protein
VEACAGTDDDTRWAECACGVKVEGFDSLAEARQELERHIADATGVPCYAPNGYQAPEVIAERTAACAASHPDRPCTTPSAAELGERADAAIRKVYGEPCQGAPAGFEVDCGIPGPHGPHGSEPVGEKPECGAWCADGPGGLCTKDLGHDGPHGPMPASAS